jgi:release factor glutamine methyltransferase
MSISGNRISDVKRLFNEKLGSLYSGSECLIFFRQAAEFINGFSMIHLHLNDQDQLLDSDILRYEHIVNRLVKLEPMQHILGYAWFMDLKIVVNSNVLIPRPETEELVNGFLERTKINNPKVLDACTGSGCIALAVNHYLPESTVTGLDISKEAINLARLNAQQLNLRVQFNEEDILKSELSELSELDAIISNPPYIPRNEMESMHETVTRYEPEIALFVDDADPLLFYKRLVYLGLMRLKSNGYLFMECHYKHLEQVAELCLQSGYKSVEQHADLSGNPRWICAVK